MIIIHNDELIHTDNMDDVLLHFGTKRRTIAPQDYSSDKFVI